MAVFRDRGGRRDCERDTKIQRIFTWIERRTLFWRIKPYSRPLSEPVIIQSQRWEKEEVEFFLGGNRYQKHTSWRCHWQQLISFGDSWTTAEPDMFFPTLDRSLVNALCTLLSANESVFHRFSFMNPFRTRGRRGCDSDDSGKWTARIVHLWKRLRHFTGSYLCTPYRRKKPGGLSWYRGSYSSRNPGKWLILNSIESDTLGKIITVKRIQSLMESQRGFKAISQQWLEKNEEYPKKSFVSIL